MNDLSADLGPEDAKLVTLARATRARARSREGAAVRDLDGRTYAAASIRLPHLRLSALEVCVAMAIFKSPRVAKICRYGLTEPLEAKVVKKRPDATILARSCVAKIHHS